MVGEDLPTLKLEKEKIESGLNLIDLVVTSKLLNSKVKLEEQLKTKVLKLTIKLYRTKNLYLKSITLKIRTLLSYHMVKKIIL